MRENYYAKTAETQYPLTVRVYRVNIGSRHVDRRVVLTVTSATVQCNCCEQIVQSLTQTFDSW